MPRYLLTLICATVLAIGFLYAKRLHFAFGIIIVLACAPLMAWLCAPIFIDLTARFIGFFRWSALGALQGKYYSFDGRHVRFFIINEAIWVPESDLARILDQPLTDRERRQLGTEYGVVPGKRWRGFTEDGITRLLASRTKDRHATRETLRFSAWLQNEALPNVRRQPDSSS